MLVYSLVSYTENAKRRAEGFYTKDHGKQIVNETPIYTFKATLSQKKR